MMVISFMCMQCVVNKYGRIMPDNSSFDIDLDHYPVLEVGDTQYYDVTCESGHSFRAFLEKERFELLFEWAVHAFIDGYYREAVTSFASALERFYEFCIYALIDGHATSEEFDKAWRSLKFSERQFGAFSLMYLQATGRACPVPSQDEVRLRNDVVHNGKFPSRDEALQYGEVVRASITKCTFQIAESKGDVLKKAYGKRFKKVGGDNTVAGLAFGSTIIDIQSSPYFKEGDHRYGSLEEVIRRVKGESKSGD